MQNIALGFSAGFILSALRSRYGWRRALLEFAGLICVIAAALTVAWLVPV